MTQSVVIKIICRNHGAMDYGDLVDIGSGLLDVKGVIDTVIGNDQFSVVTHKGNKRVIAKTKVRLCKAQECTECRNLHLCKFYLYGECRNSMGRRGCRFCHDLNSRHNATVLRDNNLQELDRSELCTLLLQNDNTLLPPVCFAYNKGDGEYGNCPDQQSCRRLHICDRYLRGTCNSEAGCPRSHDFFEPHPQKTLQERGVPNELIGSMLSVYQNIQAMRNSVNGANKNLQTRSGNADSGRKDRDKTEICLFFVKGSCKQGDRCWKDHFSMPYKWEVRNGDSWQALPDNEEIERDFCNPAHVYSQGASPIHFDTMTREKAGVRRLSTPSSVVHPTYILTTEWAWYWQDEYDNWIRYSSLERQHRLASITSEDLERKFQEDSSTVVEFTAGSQAYKLSFQDMIQTNEQYGTKRLVRRRPVFVSTTDAQKAKTRRNRPGNNFKAVPGYWDMSMLPDTGYKKITLQESSEEYQKILGLFQKTMRGYGACSIERVQNRALWEVFQWQKDLMRKNNAGKIAHEKLLFHGTHSVHVDAICKQNFDWRLCGTHGTAFGRGSYFARDANYSHSYTSSSGVRTMFVCRVLVGCYTRGDSSYLRPPSKDGGESLYYDSCVDDVRNPSIFVVFEKHQVYPEYILKYDEDMCFPFATVTVSSIGQNSVPAPSTHSASPVAAMISKPVQAPPPVSASSLTVKPTQVPPPVAASSLTVKPTQVPPLVTASSLTVKPTQVPPPVSASSLTVKPTQVPPPVAASSLIVKPTQVSPPVTASSLTLKPAQALPPVSATSVISKPTQAPPPVTPSSLTLKPAQALPPVSATSVISKPTQAPPPVTPSSLTLKPAQALPPVSATSVISKPTQAPPPVTPSSLTLKPAQALPPVSATSVISKPTQAPPPVTASSLTLKPAQAPPPVSASSVISKPTQAPAPAQASPVISKPTQASLPKDAVRYHADDLETRYGLYSDIPLFSSSSSLTNISFGTGSPPSSYRANSQTQNRASSPPSHSASSRYSQSAATGTSSQTGSSSDRTGFAASSLSGSGHHFSRSLHNVHSSSGRKNPNDKDCTIL